MREIPLTRDRVALVDDDLFDYLNQFEWFANKGRSGTLYASRWQDGKYVKMHRLIAELRGMSLDAHIDHRDGDGLNNQTFNLRAATNQQNLANRGPQKNNTSGFKGVTWNKRDKRWYATIIVNGRSRHLGCFDTALEAGLSYDQAAKTYFGEFAYSNERHVAELIGDHG